MVEKIRCPVHEEPVMALLTIEIREFEYRNIKYQVDAYFYRCPLCGEQFTTNESDDATLKQIPEYYNNVST